MTHHPDKQMDHGIILIPKGLFLWKRALGSHCMIYRSWKETHEETGVSGRAVDQESVLPPAIA